MYLVPKETVFHPETRQVVLVAGIVYKTSEFQALCDTVGADLVDVRVIMAPNLKAAQTLRENCLP